MPIHSIPNRPTRHRSDRIRPGARWCLGLAVTVVALAAGPARAGRIEERDGRTIIHVKVCYLPEPSRTDTASRAETAVLQDFRRQFPRIFADRYRERYRADPRRYGRHDWDHVEIVLEPFTGISVQGVETDLLAIAGGLAPDLLYVNFRKSDNYIQSNFLYPLDRPEDQYLAALPAEEVAFRIYPKIWPVIKRTGPSRETHVWSMPIGGALGKVLLYRKDLFDRHGLAYPTADWTWDDMLRAAKTLTDPQAGTYGIALGAGNQESWYWVTFLWSAGCEVMEYNPAIDQWRCTFNGPGAAEALDFYIVLSAEKWIDRTGKIRRGYASKDPGEASMKWERGEIGMCYDYVDEKLFSRIDPELTGMAPVPLGPTGKRGAELNSRMMGLFAGIESPVVRDAAWEYLRYITSREAERTRTRMMVEGGLGKFVIPKYLRQFGYPEIERLSPKGWAETFTIAIETSRPEPYGRNSNLAYEMMSDPLHAAEQMMLRDQLPEAVPARLAVLQQILDQAVGRANEEMIGVIPPAERRQRRLAAALALAGIVTIFSLVFRKISRTFSPPVGPGQAARGWQFRRYRWAYLILVPAVLTILIWQYVPLIRGSVMAFQDYQLMKQTVWVGLDNFGDLLFDGAWWGALWNSLRYSFLVMALTFLPPIVLAILLQEVPRGKILFRTIYYLPAVVTGIVTVLLWKLFYEPSERGALNAVVLHIPAIGFVALGALLLGLAVAFARRLWLQGLRLTAWGFVAAGLVLFVTCAGMAGPILFPAREPFLASLGHLAGRLCSLTPEPYRWLTDPHMSMLACVLPMVWAGMGPGCLIYLAALKGIPDDYFEAADLDGATFIDQILFVVFPTLRALVIINFVGAFVGAWQGAAGNILVLTGGGAGTKTADLHIWYKAFTYLKFGPATAMAWMLGFLLIGFTVQQLGILSRVEFRTTTGKK